MKLNLRSVDLNLLTIFDAIMSERKMTLAAKRLHMTQPAASHALTRLRQTYDDELFIRTRAGMKPTPRAEALAGPIRDALLVIQETLEPNAAFDPRASDREFKIAFGRYGELSVLPRLLEAIDQQGTAISIQSHGDDTGDAISLIKDATLDFCLDFRLPEDDRLDGILCEHEEMVVIARNGHPRISKRLSKKKYFSEKHIVASMSEKKRELFQNFMKEQGGERDIMAEVNQVTAIPLLIAQTDSIATLPRSTAEMFQHTHQLNMFPLLFDVPKLPIYLIWNKALNRDKGHQWLKELIVTCLA